MKESSIENILLMAIFRVTKSDVLACANELGIPEEQITDDVMELVKEYVSQGLAGWQGVIKDMVKEIIKMDAVECPLGVACSPSCVWREVGQCLSLSQVE